MVHPLKGQYLCISIDYKCYLSISTMWAGVSNKNMPWILIFRAIYITKCNK